MSAKPSSIELVDTVSEVLYGIAGWLLIGLGTAAFLSGLGGIIQNVGTADIVVPFFVLLFALLFMALGVMVNPRFRRQLNRQHGISRFGQVRAVDSRVLSASENRTKSCVSCGSDMNEGLVRRYRQEYVIAGIPVRTTSEKQNYYCSTCAMQELPTHPRTNIEKDSSNVQEITEAE